MDPATVSASRAAKLGIAQTLSRLTYPDGSAVALEVLYKAPRPNQEEVLPRCAIVGQLDETRDDGQEEWDLKDGTILVRVGTLEGTLHLLLSTQDDEAGDGEAEDRADLIVAGLQQEFHKGAVRSLDADDDDGDEDVTTQLHGVAETVDEYYGAQFVYNLLGVDDPPLEMVVHGLADVVIRVQVVGPVLQVREVPSTDPVLGLDDDGDDVYTDVDIDRDFPEED